MILFIRKAYGLHRTTAHKSSCFTHVHPNTVNVHLVSREGLQLAGLPLIAWTVTASAAVREKVGHAYIYENFIHPHACWFYFIIK